MKDRITLNGRDERRGQVPGALAAGGSSRAVRLGTSAAPAVPMPRAARPCRAGPTGDLYFAEQMYLTAAARAPIIALALARVF